MPVFVHQHNHAEGEECPRNDSGFLLGCSVGQQETFGERFTHGVAQRVKELGCFLSDHPSPSMNNAGQIDATGHVDCIGDSLASLVVSSFHEAREFFKLEDCLATHTYPTTNLEQSEE